MIISIEESLSCKFFLLVFLVFETQWALSIEIQNFKLSKSNLKDIFNFSGR